MGSDPMGTIARSSDPRLLALVRYVETKCLLGGVTSSQGISLQSDQLDAYYRGAMRVVETRSNPGSQSLDPHPGYRGLGMASVQEDARARLLPVAPSQRRFGRQGSRRLSGIAKHPGPVGDQPRLAGIHCAGLHAEDFAVLASKAARWCGRR